MLRRDKSLLLPDPPPQMTPEPLSRTDAIAADKEKRNPNLTSQPPEEAPSPTQAPGTGTARGDKIAGGAITIATEEHTATGATPEAGNLP